MYLRKLVIENLKAFERAEFDFTQQDANGLAGWTVLVGGNASGKSTVLKLIALALMGPAQGNVALRNPEGWIRNGQPSGRVEAEIEIAFGMDGWIRHERASALPTDALAAGLEWIEYQSQAGGIDFGATKSSQVGTHLGPWNPNASGWFCCGYGPWRRLSGSSPDAARDAVAPGALRRHVTLFREDASLAEAEAWLREHQFKMLEQGGPESDAGQFLALVRSIVNDGLLPAGFVLQDITSEHVYVAREGLRLPLRDVSDGCRSVLALVLDLLRHLADCYGVDAMRKATHLDCGIALPGVVLIDEVEAHLHPRWQRELPAWLTRHFPALQFIVTTHGPLIAQSADRDGIFVLPMPDEGDRTPRKLSSAECDAIRLGRADHTLLGAAFGLGSTRSLAAERETLRYQALASKRRALALSEGESAEYETLRTALQNQFSAEDRMG